MKLPNCGEKEYDSDETPPHNLCASPYAIPDENSVVEVDVNSVVFQELFGRTKSEKKKVRFEKIVDDIVPDKRLKIDENNPNLLTYRLAPKSDEPCFKRHCRFILLMLVLLAIVCVAVPLAVLLPKQRVPLTIEVDNNTVGDDAVPPPKPNSTSDDDDDDKVYKCIESNAELYAAVDAYLLNSNANTTLASIFGYPIGSWCLSPNVTNMDELFSGSRSAAAGNFSGDISNWDVSHVVSMSGLFRSNRAFSGPLPWNTSRVVDMSRMFEDSVFDHESIASWDTGSVQDFSRMFQGSKSLFRKVSVAKFNVTSAKNLRNAFRFASKFQENLCWYGTQLSDLTDVSNMFGGTSCPNKTDPILEGRPGPFCYNCG